jgi:hypothetical protein
VAEEPVPCLEGQVQSTTWCSDELSNDDARLQVVPAPASTTVLPLQGFSAAVTDWIVVRRSPLHVISRSLPTGGWW